MRFQTLGEWLTWQETLHPKPIDLGLERVARVAGRLDLLQPACTVITVGGTNGKGSTVAMLDSIYRAAGYRTCSFTSPHLLRYNERIRLNGVPAQDGELCEAFAQVDAARGDDTLSYFEFATLAALWIARAADVEVLILEVGLGGRLDAVNILDADAAIVASVGLDHQQWLGEDRERIGAEKAGIFRADRPAICGDHDPPASLFATAQRLGARWMPVGSAFSWRRRGAAAWDWHAADGYVRENLPIPALAGEMQLDNASCALAAVRVLHARLPVDSHHVAEGLRSARPAGRFQQIRSDPVVIVDVAHNPPGALALSAVLQATLAAGRTLGVFAAMADKDLDAMIAALAPRMDRWFAGGLPDIPRAAGADTLCERIRAVTGHTPVCREELSEAFSAACAAAGPGDRVVVFGSFHTVARVLQPGDVP